MAETPLICQFIIGNDRVVNRILRGIKRFLKKKATALVFGLLFFYSFLFTWYLTEYLYSFLLFVPAASLLLRYYLLSKSSQNPRIISLLGNPLTWVWIVIYVLAVGARHNVEYTNIPIARISVFVFMAVSAILLLRYYLKHLAPRKSETSSSKRNYAAAIVIYCYIFPFLDDHLLPNIITGLIPLLVYFLLRKRDATVTDLPKPDELPVQQNTVGWRNLFTSLSTSSKLLFLLAAVLGLVSFFAEVTPNQFLPEEQRELFYYENPLFLMQTSEF